MAGSRGTHQETAPGMSRFFSQANIDRYRKLANGAVSKAEQCQLLGELTAEMHAFKCEARLVAARGEHSSRSRDDSHHSPRYE
jgi:hypothetical protein